MSLTRCCVSVCASHLLLGLAVLPLARLLLDVRCHGKGGPVMAVSQVDDVGDRRQHGALAAGVDDGVSFTHRQQQLTSTCIQSHIKQKISGRNSKKKKSSHSLTVQKAGSSTAVYLNALFDPEVAAHGLPVLRAADVEQPLVDAPLHGGIKHFKELGSDQRLGAAKAREERWLQLGCDVTSRKALISEDNERQNNQLIHLKQNSGMLFMLKDC